jgi:hypothetical protein
MGPLADAVTVTETCAVWGVVAVVPVPIIVNVYVFAGAVGLAETVSVEALPDVTDVGLNDALSPAGTFAIVKATA